MKVYNPNAIGVTTGFGVPTGGTSGQVLVKNSGNNYDTQWSDRAKKWVNLAVASDLTEYGLNSEVIWGSAVIGLNSGITVNNQNITLPAGTYQVTAVIATHNYSDTENGYFNLRFVNTSNIAIAGLGGANPGPPSATYLYDQVNTIVGIIQLATQTTIKLIINAANGTGTVNTFTRATIIEI